MEINIRMKCIGMSVNKTDVLVGMQTAGPFHLLPPFSTCLVLGQYTMLAQTAQPPVFGRQSCFIC